MSLTTLTLEDLFVEISDLARDQGVSSKEQWDEVIDEVIESHLDLGELDLEQDTEGMKEILQTRWGAFKKESAIAGAEEDEEEDGKDDKEDLVDEDEDEKKKKDDEEDYYGNEEKY